MTRARRRLLPLALIGTLLTMPAASTAAAPSSDGDRPHHALAALRASQPELRAHRDPATGAFNHVLAPAGDILVEHTVDGTAEARAYAFLAEHGGVVGMNQAERARAAAQAQGSVADGSHLVVRSADDDPVTGVTHVSFDQRFDDREVFGARLIVHMTDAGVTGISGTFIDGVVEQQPLIDRARAIRRAIATTHAPAWEDLEASSAELVVYRDGAIEGRPGRNLLAWEVDVTGLATDEQVFIDARDASIVNRISRIHAARDRCAYTPTYDPQNPDLFVARAEGDPPTLIPPVDNLFRFSGQVYDLFDRAFGRDSWDGAGAKMRTVYEIGPACPNAFWRGSDRTTRYCPGFDIDDVVAHEWGHAYTQGTHGLIYQMQPGALNESYSDIWGEVVDLLNDEDGIGGDNNDQPFPDGQRWVVGEDLTEPVADAVVLRDMWNPNRRGLPGKVSDPLYFCGSGDNGGVHYNSAVPNHAFAMLVDGKEYNGHTVGGIGLDKASHIYWQAQVAYQVPFTGFAEHAEALIAACGDLIGVDPNGLLSGSPIGDVINANDCLQVEEAVEATEMRDPPVACGGTLLSGGAPVPCPGSTTLLSEDWEDGLTGWTLENAGVTAASWPGYDWEAVGSLPDDRAGVAAFADNTGDANACGANSSADHAGRFSITSGELIAPAEIPSLQLRFDHYVATETLDDGGNVRVSVNDGPFVSIPAADYLFNAPNATLRDGNNGPDNPKKNQAAFTGGDAGVLTGTWGTSIVELGDFVSPGDTFRIQFEFGQDCVVGADGWYVDDVLLTVCPPTPAPLLALGSDYEAPDSDGSFTLEWERLEGATGPDELQVAPVQPFLFADSANDGFAQWELATSGDAFEWQTVPGTPGHLDTAFWAPAHEASTEGSATMTTSAPISIPSAGETQLTFSDWQSNHGGDSTIVEVSENGEDWSIVYGFASDSVLPHEAAISYVLDDLTPRVVDLTSHAGKDVFLRFRFKHGATLYIDVARMGWYVDDITIEHFDWSTVTTTSDTSYLVSGAVPGAYRYRVRTTYTFGSETALSPWSEQVLAFVT